MSRYLIDRIAAGQMSSPDADRVSALEGHGECWKRFAGASAHQAGKYGSRFAPLSVHRWRSQTRVVITVRRRA